MDLLSDVDLSDDSKGAPTPRRRKTVRFREGTREGRGVMSNSAGIRASNAQSPSPNRDFLNSMYTNMRDGRQRARAAGWKDGQFNSWGSPLPDQTMGLGPAAAAQAARLPPPRDHVDAVQNHMMSTNWHLTEEGSKQEHVGTHMAGQASGRAPRTHGVDPDTHREVVGTSGLRYPRFRKKKVRWATLPPRQRGGNSTNGLMTSL